jgi:DNA polymerase III subunit delta'
MPVVDAQGQLPLPWLAAPLATALAQQRGHATLVHGAPGVGALEFALALAQAQLCEASAPGAPAAPACGRCGSCRLVQAGLHPDLFVLLPEVQRRSTGWLLNDDKPEGEELKRKPSKQIRIDDVRLLIDWSHKTNARGRGKVVVLHPADAMNLQSASALLKTLEEPPAGTRLFLTTADPAHLLPTVLSRCQRVSLPAPPRATVAAWLAGQGVAQPEVLLAACNGRPLDALALLNAGVDATAWAALPGAVARGQVAALAGWAAPLLVDALQKLCHDAMARSVGGAACYFPADSLPRHAALPALLDWAAELARVARHVDHPWSEALLLDALVQQGRKALAVVPLRDKDAAEVAGRGFATLRR